MRTVDPELWYKKVKKPRIQVTRTMRFGLKTPTGFEYLMRASFIDAISDFRNNCSVRAIVRVHSIDDHCIKNSYAILNTMFLCLGLCVVCYNAYILGNKPPLLINLQSNHHSIQYNIHFPAVAVCSNNIFSSKALQKYTTFLDSLDNNSTYTEGEIKANLMKFGALINLALPPVDVMFMKFLTRVHPNFNVTEFMLKLSPQCPSFLRRCSWRGRAMPCDKLFGTRLTPLGFCCVFNSRYQPEDHNTPPKILDLAGQDFGLSFVLNNTEDDSGYVRRPRDGYELLVFEGSEYPLTEGGGVRLYPLEQDASMFFAVSVREERPSHTLNYYSEKWRGCRLRDSSPRKWWGSSYAWCLAECRRRTVVSLCGCRLHTLPPGDAHAPLCTTSHLACLNKHREKFMYYYPGVKWAQSAHAAAALGEELQDGQECLHCVPDCARRVYSADIARIRYPHVRHDKLFKNYVSNYMALTNATIVRVFYTTEHQQLYTVEANLRWYETVALLGSQWVSVMSVTALFISELVFYCTIRWAHHYRRRARTVQQMKGADKS